MKNRGLLLILLFAVSLAGFPSGLYAVELNQAIAAAKQDIEQQLNQLNALRSQISQERSSLSQNVRQLDAEVAKLREKAASFRHAKWYRDAGFDQLKEDAGYLSQEVDYAASLIADYRRSMMKRMHGSEAQRFENVFPEIDAILDAPDKGTALKALAPLLAVAQQRNDENFGGHIFTAKAANDAGFLHEGRFVLMGPAAYFLSEDGKLSGISAVKLNSTYPGVLHPVDRGDLKKILKGEETELPVDVTLGEAAKMAEKKKTWWNHIKSGGVIMVPILALGLACLVIAVWRFRFIRKIRRDVEGELPVLFEMIQEGKIEEAARHARSLGQPWGPVLAEGAYHHNVSIEHLEEILHEKTLSQIPYLERNLAMLAVSAAASPLLGLLGTVTGMIHTFDLVAVFGTGKANLLSGGISEALVTTEYGLFVAIPALLAHAYLSRQVQKILHQLEQINTSFVNGLKMRRFRNFEKEEVL